MSIGEENQTEDYIKLNQSHRSYLSDLYTGDDAHRFLTSIWPDFKTDKCDVVLHEQRSGYAGTHMVMWASTRSVSNGVQLDGVEVTGYDMGSGNASSAPAAVWAAAP